MFPQLLLLLTFTVVYLPEVRIILKKREGERVNGKVSCKLKIADKK